MRHGYAGEVGGDLAGLREIPGIGAVMALMVSALRIWTPTSRLPESTLPPALAEEKVLTVGWGALAVLTCVRNGGMTGQGINVDGGGLQS